MTVSPSMLQLPQHPDHFSITALSLFVYLSVSGARKKIAGNEERMNE